MKLQVGQKLFYVSSSRWRTNPTRWLAITKVGRKWAYLENGDRVYVETLFVDGAGYSTPGRCYLTEEEYQKEKHKTECWRVLWNWVDARHQIPRETNIEAIQAAANALGVTLPRSEEVKPNGK